MSLKIAQISPHERLTKIIDTDLLRTKGEKTPSFHISLSLSFVNMTILFVKIVHK